MTVLSACQEAAVDLNQEEPTSLFSSDIPFAKELRVQANRTAKAIAKAYEWQKLMAIHTLTGDGTTTAFDLPANYDRMPFNSDLMTSSFGNTLAKARDANQWLDFQINDTVIGEPGRWIIIGGQMQILEPIATGDTVKFYYIKNTIATDGSGAEKTAFTLDTDTFYLPERLITLGVIWRWRAMKRKEYAEDLRNFEIAMSEEVAGDKGSRMLLVGRPRLPISVAVSYPRALG